MVGNMILANFGNCQISTKVGTLYPSSIAESLLKIQEIPNHAKHILLIYLKISEIMFFENVKRVGVGTPDGLCLIFLEPTILESQ